MKDCLCLENYCSYQIYLYWLNMLLGRRPKTGSANISSAGHISSGVASPKFGLANTLTLSWQEYFVWNTASQCTKRQDILEIWGSMSPLLGYAYAQKLYYATVRGPDFLRMWLFRGMLPSTKSTNFCKYVIFSLLTKRKNLVTDKLLS